jgi:adenylate cyclase, class 2
MMEIEKKYRLTADRMSRIKTLLEESGAKFLGDDFEENIIFGGGSLKENAKVLRIRKTQDRAILTLKIPVESYSGMKHRLEHETGVTNADTLNEILTALGFLPRLIYEKRRATWHFRNVEVVLDELPFGLYMEVEGSVTAIREAEILLDLDDLEVEHLPYPRLTAQHGVKTGSTVAARFPKDEQPKS